MCDVKERVVVPREPGLVPDTTDPEELLLYENINTHTLVGASPPRLQILSLLSALHMAMWPV